MRNVTITFDPNAKAGQAAMADNRPLVKKLAIYAENVGDRPAQREDRGLRGRAPALCQRRPF